MSTTDGLARREAAAQLRERFGAAGVQYVYLQLVSIDGRVIGKGVPLAQFDQAAQKGIQLHMTALTDLRTDRRGRYLVFGAEATEFAAVPDLATCAVLPWDRRVAVCLCDLYSLEGGPLAYDARGNLRRLVNELQTRFALQFRTGIEPEMMFLQQDTAAGLTAPTQPYAYHIAQMEALRPVILELTAAAEALGLTMIQGAHEDAPGQVELNFAPADPLRTADSLVLYRQAAAAVGQQHGLIASFMPKPFADLPANGHHHHVSATGADGADAFADAAGVLTAAGRHFIGGLLAHSDGLTCLCAPTINSYKRFWNTGHWAPITKTWGVQNRTTLVRVVEGGHLEFRLPDAACNPYLSIAAMLAAGCDGMARQLEPGPPQQDNTYAAGIPGAYANQIPLTLPEAVAALRDDSVLTAALSPELTEAFTALRRDDWERYCGQVSEWERQRYLTYLP